MPGVGDRPMFAQWLSGTSSGGSDGQVDLDDARSHRAGVDADHPSSVMGRRNSGMGTLPSVVRIAARSGRHHEFRTSPPSVGGSIRLRRSATAGARRRQASPGGPANGSEVGGRQVEVEVGAVGERRHTGRPSCEPMQIGVRPGIGADGSGAIRGNIGGGLSAAWRQGQNRSAAGAPAPGPIGSQASY